MGCHLGDKVSNNTQDVDFAHTLYLCVHKETIIAIILFDTSLFDVGMGLYIVRAGLPKNQQRAKLATRVRTSTTAILKALVTERD